MQRRGGGTSSGFSEPQRETILHHPAPQHPLNPRNLHSSPPPGVSSFGGGSAATSPADYQRFSSPPATQQQQPPHLQDSYQNFHSPAPNLPPHQPQAAPNLYGQQAQQPYGAGGNNGYAGQGMGGWPPQFGAGMMNDATAQMGVQFGKSAVQAGQEYMNRNITRHLPVQHLLHSFNVSNSYVLHKLRLILFPWRHRPWSRLVKRNETSGQVEGYKPPRDDINSPDMYIPVMSLVTYILLSGVVAGARGEFHPDNLGMTASKSLGIVFIEFCGIKLGTYLLNIGGEGTVVDLFSYSGYKFVGIIVTLFCTLVSVRGWLYWLIFIYVFCSNAFFLLRSLRYVVLPDPSLAAQQGFNASGAPSVSTAGSGGSSVSHAQRSRRIKFLFFIAVSQVGSMWYLARV